MDFHGEVNFNNCSFHISQGQPTTQPVNAAPSPPVATNNPVPVAKNFPAELLARVRAQHQPVPTPPPPPPSDQAGENDPPAMRTRWVLDPRGPAFGCNWETYEPASETQLAASPASQTQLPTDPAEWPPASLRRSASSPPVRLLNRRLATPSPGHNAAFVVDQNQYVETTADWLQRSTPAKAPPLAFVVDISTNRAGRHSGDGEV